MPRTGKTEKPAAKKRDSLRKLLAGLPPGKVGFVEPMKCRLLEKLPEGDDWVYEIKFDGFRGLAIKNGSAVQLLSRNNKDLGSKFPTVLRALQKLPCDKLMLDGEVVALDEQGRSSFQLLQTVGERPSDAGLAFYTFD